MDSKISKLIGEIAEQVAKNDLAEITYEEGDIKVKVVGKQTQQLVSIDDSEVVSNKPISESSSNVKYVRSPMVGVVYLTPSPNEKPYVESGSIVNNDTTVCVIEAMKTYNPIKAGYTGVIGRVLVKNGDPIEFDQPIAEIIFDK